MPNYLLTAIKSDEGFIFICPKCQARGITALGTNDEVGRHLLICPICRTTLGAWLTSESREWELAALAEKLERSLAYCPSASRGKVAYQISISRFLQLIRAYRLRTAVPGAFWNHIAIVIRKIRFVGAQGSTVAD